MNNSRLWYSLIYTEQPFLSENIGNFFLASSTGLQIYQMVDSTSKIFQKEKTYKGKCIESL